MVPPSRDRQRAAVVFDRPRVLDVDLRGKHRGVRRIDELRGRHIDIVGIAQIRRPISEGVLHRLREHVAKQNAVSVMQFLGEIGMLLLERAKNLQSLD